MTENIKIFFLKQFNSASGKLSGIALLLVFFFRLGLLHDVFLSPIAPAGAEW